MAKRTPATALEPLAPIPTFPLEEQTPAVKVLLALLEHERTSAPRDARSSARPRGRGAPAQRASARCGLHLIFFMIPD